ncbi:MAG: hypothetical protein AAFR01_09350, partial [Pseudomonadota bacterium]
MRRALAIAISSVFAVFTHANASEQTGQWDDDIISYVASLDREGRCFTKAAFGRNIYIIGAVNRGVAIEEVSFAKIVSRVSA